MTSWLRRLVQRLRSSFASARLDGDLDEEIAAHLEFATEENQRQGMTPEEARRRALVSFGGHEQATQRQREARGFAGLDILFQDLRYAVRTFRRNYIFTFFIVLILALGIGATTAMFSVINAVLLKPLPYREPGRVVLLTRGVTPVRFDEMKAASRSYTALGAFAGVLEQMAFSGAGTPEVLKGARVSANFLQILGVSPLHGRSFLSEEDTPGAPGVVMISAPLWQRRFGGDPRIIGQTVRLAGAPNTIIGVLPAGFQFPVSGADVWVTKPSELSTIDAQSRPISPILKIFGRLKPHVSIQQADAELAVLKGQYAKAHPGMLDAKPNSIERLRPLKDEVVSDVRPKLWMLFGAVGLVLLIVCANIGSLLLARATSRSREFAVRAAIGAGRGRIIRQLLAESVLLASVGGVLGIALAASSLRAVRTMTFIDLPRAGEIHMDGIVLGFAVALSIVTGVLFGLVPSLVVSRPNLVSVLKGSNEVTSAMSSMSSQTSKKKMKMMMRFGPRGLLVVGQVALSFVLLIGATLLIESLAHLYRVDPGFQPAHLLAMHIDLPPARYDTDGKRAAFYEELVQRTESLPGVRNAAVSLTLPMSGWIRMPVQLASGLPMKLNERPIAIIQLATPEYFRTLEIALKRGREFTAHDNQQSAPVAIINESLARQFWPQYPNGPDPIGKQLLMGNNHPPREIVGISADVHEDGKDQDPRPGLYVPCAQVPDQSAAFIVRTDGDPLLLADTVRRQVLAIDAEQPVSDVTTMDAVVEGSEGQLRLMMRLLGAFAIAATLLAMFGLYGVISYSVVQRTKEIGIRSALGAQRGDILSLVVRQGFLFSTVGVLLGVCAALALTGVMRDLLFHVCPADPLTFAGVSMLFVLVALAASYIPARRATGIDPMAALRLE